MVNNFMGSSPESLFHSSLCLSQSWMCFSFFSSRFACTYVDIEAFYPSHECGSIEVFHNFTSVVRKPVAYQAKARMNKIHFMKYGNLRETNFICVITKLGHIPSFELSPFYSTILFFHPYSLLVRFYPEVYFITCNEQHTVKLISKVCFSLLFSAIFLSVSCSSRVCLCIHGRMSPLCC